MRIATAVFTVLGLFYIPVVLVYAAMGGEPVGVGGMALASGLGLMIAGYLRLSGRNLAPQPEEDEDGDVRDHAGEQGEFSPWSWWPLPLAGCAAVIFFGMAVGWWVSIVGAALGAVALVGWVFEYYRGSHAH